MGPILAKILLVDISLVYSILQEPVRPILDIGRSRSSVAETGNSSLYMIPHDLDAVAIKFD